MSYTILTGKQRSLVFPIMCNAFLTIDYSDSIPTSEVAYGIWELEEDFTFECVLTPYDINGYGSESETGHQIPVQVINQSSNIISSSNNITTDSKKIMPALFKSVYTVGEQFDYESELYITRTARLTHEMRIFSSTNLQISLVNDTLHNENNPARYKIKVGIKLGSNSMEYFTSDAVILPNQGYRYKYVSSSEVSPSTEYSLSGFNDEGKMEYHFIGKPSGANTGATIPFTNFASALGFLFGGNKQELFVRDGQDFISLGTINTASASSDSPRTIVLTSSPTVSLSNTSELYIKAALEPVYINNTYHIACSWDNENKKINIFLDGKVIKIGTHTKTDDFSMVAEDFFIGATGGGATGAGSATTNKQFMGELHELSIMNKKVNSFSAINNLMPNFNDTVLYLRFEEVDE